MAHIADTLKPTLIIGASGQVGSALVELLGDAAIAPEQDELDLLQLDTLEASLAALKPRCIINPAAYTAVDKAEEEAELAHTINADAVRIIARYAFARNIPFIHYSTDYVFPGNGTTAWQEDDSTGPLNVYGKTKLAGEQAVQEEAAQHANAQWLIFRTSWVYDEKGQNFVNSMLRLGKEREVLSIVADQIGAPTYAGDIALYTLKALEKAQQASAFPSGIYHLCNSGETNWHAFAEAIFRTVSNFGETLEIKDVKETTTADYPTPATRPLNSRMNMQKLYDTFGITMPEWQDALTRCLHHKFHNETAQKVAQ